MDALQALNLDPAQILAIFDQALDDPDVTVSRLRCLGQILSGRQVEDFDEETVFWVSQFIPSSMYVSTSSFKEVPEHKHGDAATQLAREQLQAIDFGKINGQQVKDLDAFIQEHGALHVLYALWCSKGKGIKNPCGWITWSLREGHQAPAGWLPVELREEETPEPVEESQAVEELSQRSERPETPEELLSLWEDLQAHVEPLIRPGSFTAWIEPLSLVSIEENQTLVLWAPDGFAADWVETRFNQPLQRVVRALGYEGYRFTWERRRPCQI